MQSCLSLCAAWKTWYLCTREGASHISHPGHLGASPAHLPASRGCATPILLALSQKWRAYSRRVHGTCFIFTFRGDAAVLIRHSHSVYTLCTVLSGMCGAFGLSFARLVRGSKLQIGLYGGKACFHTPMHLGLAEVWATAPLQSVDNCRLRLSRRFT